MKFVLKQILLITVLMRNYIYSLQEICTMNLSFQIFATKACLEKYKNIKNKLNHFSLTTVWV